jgi:hypothetical protein
MSHPTHTPHAHTPEVHEAPDTWHTHTVEEHPMAPHAERVDSWKVFVIGLINYLFCVATIVAIWIYFAAYKDSLKITSEEFPEEFENQQPVHKPALDRRQEVLGPVFKNDKPVWTDAKAGEVTIPMDKAMAKVMDRYQAPR